MVTRPEPIATYRVQLTPDFGFADVVGILEHIADLGVSHVYLSPIGTAMPGSTHGYDWVPPPQVAPELGGREGLRALRAAASVLGLGIIIDIVPNHTGVAVALRNPWFADLLRHGPGSRYATYFDADFSSDNGADGALALPVLASDGDLTPLTVDAHGILRYHDHAFPTAPGTLGGTPEEVHARQHYRLVPWDSGLIGYRRFFTVNELAGLRQEDPAVYDATHAWLRDLLDADLIDGVRVDHPDGLWDPMGYLERLRGEIGADRLLYIEKILAADEALEPTLPVDGTTGYDQLRVIEALFTAPSGIVELSEIHEHVTGVAGDARWLHATERSRKITTLQTMFPAEHRRLVRALTHSDPSVDAASVADAVGELIADLGVYRADYPSLRSRLVTAADAIVARRPDLADSMALIIRTTETPGAATSRLAQTCGAVTAKSVEDSLFYRTARLVSAQEVGADPADPALSLHDFHRHNVIRARQWPRAMTASSTHDTKRGEDVRARVALLAQVPERWSMTIRRIWAATPPPDDFTGYFLLQNILGVWPTDGAVTDELRTRLVDYARKASREAALKTTWTEVDEQFESALSTWIDTITTGEPAEVITGLVSRLAPAWEQESLARKAIALLGPGVPDIYQGTEWFEDSLVDPDNRRPVDYRRSTDHPKVRLVQAALGVRSTHAAAFGPDGDYRPILAEGPASDHVVAFGRGVTGEVDPRVIVATSRFTHSLLPPDGAKTMLTLPPGDWLDAVSGATHSGSVSVADLRAVAPVAILTR
ncbi:MULTISPECIES: malto-oligosyltrehalose synthase [unclassified Gordonia (in: high G+C Gram-positive bacteria)]